MGAHLKNQSHTGPKHPFKHHPECQTLRCARHADMLWAQLHRPRALEAATGPSQGISAHERCIIEHESSGNPQAVSGKYEGIGQWQQSTWEEDGGLRYAPTPLGASYAQQEAILRGEGEAGMSRQQGQYDGCG